MANIRLKGGTFSELAKKEERLAYLLLIPSFIVLVVIAFYPLGSVFVNSFTNRGFATGTPTEYVGFDNYARLLNITIKPLPPIIDPATGQPKIDPKTGSIQYADAFDVLPKQPVRFRALTEFNIFGNRYVIGAVDQYFWPSILDTVFFTVSTVVLELVLGMGIALVVNKKFKGRGMMRAVMLLPWAIPTAVSSKMWEWIFQSSRIGLMNVITQDLGLTNGQFPFLTTHSFQIPAMIIIDVWKTTPFMTLLLLAGLQLIPDDLYEAASVDGASRLYQFFRITIPLLRPTIAIALVFRTLDALRVFDLFQIVLAQSRYSMASYVYYQLVGNAKMGYSSAASVIIFLIILVFAVLYIRILGVEND